MPVKQQRTSRITRDQRRIAAKTARDLVSGIGNVSMHSVLTCESQDRLAPIEVNALRIVIDGWAASMHRTAIPILIHIDEGASDASVRESVLQQLDESVRSQWKRAVQAHRAGIREPVTHDPFSATVDCVEVGHLDGHYLEMLRLHHEGGADRVRGIYGGIAAVIMARRINGISGSYEPGSLTGMEVSAMVPIGDHAALRKSKLDLDRHLPETVLTAMKGRPLGDFIEAGGIDHVEVWEAEARPGNPLAKGIARKPHTRIHLMRDMKTGVASFLSCR